MPTYSNDPTKIFDAACEFPWPLAAFSSLERYMVSVDQYFELATDLQAKMIKKAIEVAIDPVEVGELQFALEQVECEDQSVNRRLVWGGVLVSIYAAFEQGLEQIFEHWCETAASPKFRAKGSEDVVTAAARHSSEYIGVQLFKTPSERESVDQLRILRKSFVHKGGRLSTVPPTIWAAIQLKKKIGFPLETLGERWCANFFMAEHYRAESLKVLSRYSGEVFSKLGNLP